MVGVIYKKIIIRRDFVKFYSIDVKFQNTKLYNFKIYLYHSYATFFHIQNPIIYHYYYDKKKIEAVNIDQALRLDLKISWFQA